MLFFSKNRGERKRKSKINPFSSPDLQFVHFGIKINSEVTKVCKKKKKINLVSYSQIPSTELTNIFQYLKMLEAIKL